MQSFRLPRSQPASLSPHLTGEARGKTTLTTLPWLTVPGEERPCF